MSFFVILSFINVVTDVGLPIGVSWRAKDARISQKSSRVQREGCIFETYFRESGDKGKMTPFEISYLVLFPSMFTFHFRMRKTKKRLSVWCSCM